MLCLSLSHTHTLSLSQKIPMKDLRTSGGNVLELDVIKKAKECPFIVHFYGCLLREVISQAFDSPPPPPLNYEMIGSRVDMYGIIGLKHGSSL